MYQDLDQSVFITNPQGKIAYANSKAIDLSDTTLQKLKGKTLSGLFPDIKNKYLNIRIRQEKFFSVKSKFSLNSRQGKFLTVSFMLIEHEKSVVGILAIINSDQEKNTRVKDEFRVNPVMQIIGKRPDQAWFILDMNHRVNVFCSESFYSMTGWKASQYLEGGWAFYFSLIHPDYIRTASHEFHAQYESRLKDPFLHDYVPIKLEYPIRKHNGNYLHVQELISVMERDSSGRIMYFIGVIKPQIESRDIRLKSKRIPAEALKVIEGKIFLSLDYLRKLRTKSQTLKSDNHAISEYRLTKREQEILRLILKGMSSEEIHSTLNISKNTVNMHRKQLMKKMNAKNIADLVAKGLRLGISG